MQKSNLKKEIVIIIITIIITIIIMIIITTTIIIIIIMQCIMIMSQCTAQKIKFSIKVFFSKCDQIRSFQWIWSHLLMKFFMENFIFGAVVASGQRRTLSISTQMCSQDLRNCLIWEILQHVFNQGSWFYLSIGFGIFCSAPDACL